MTRDEVRIDGRPVEAGDADWRLESLEWLDRRTARARLVDGERSVVAVVEGQGSEWFVTLRGRRIPVTVRTARERLLAEAELVARVQAGPVVVTATLPGLVVAIAVSPGDEVQDGSPLLTIEAMKMQNEVRAPRAGTVLELSVEPGQAVGTGMPLLRLE